MSLVWRATLVGAVLVLGWRSVSLGLGESKMQAAQNGDPREAKAALAWSPRNRDALAALASAESAGSPPGGAGAWSTLLRADPTSSDALLGIAYKTKDTAQAESLVRQAVALAPANPEVLKRAAAFWIEQGKPEQGVAVLSEVMIADPSQRQVIVPFLVKLFEDPSTRPLLTPYAESPPAWWDAFFRSLAADAADVETVRALAAVRRLGSSVPLSQTERDAYVTRLRKEGLTTEAYLIWVNGLDDIHRQQLGLLNNGNFETESTGNGWDWRLTPTKNLIVEVAKTYGTRGKKALHLVFRGFDKDLRHVSQDLFLGPGVYKLSGMSRPNGLKTTGGLRWAVDCVEPGSSTRLGQTERFLGSSAWQPFQMQFAIPDSCDHPVLRLVNDVRVSGDRRLDGDIWFDELRIQRLDIAPMSQ